MISSSAFLLLFIVGFVAAFLSGSTAVGGAALMTATLGICIGGEYVVPILTIVMLIANMARAAMGYKEIDWRSVGQFLITALPLSLLGALGYTLLPEVIVNKIIGATVIVFVILKYIKFSDFVAGKTSVLLMGLISGFLSGFVGSSGPISAALFFSLGLSPVGYVASEAAAVSILHISKIIVYGSLMDIKFELWVLSAVIGCAMIAGTVFAKRFINNMRADLFNKYITIVMVFMGIYMILS